jgi:16S rRNA (uracil1498-N3)-methyltransferase
MLPDMSERFYINSALATGSVLIQGAEAHHLTTVCRLRTGDHVTLFNGDDREYSARIDAAGRRQVSLTVLDVKTVSRELPFHLIVAAPLPKGGRGDVLVEKLTELGVTRFVPLRSERSVVHPRDSKLDRLQRTVIETCKQCGRNALMQIGELTNWEEFCTRADLPQTRLLAQTGGGPFKHVEFSGDTCCAIGPEGGFTEREASLAIGRGWKAIELGERILRVETAAIAMAVLAGQGR